METVQQNGRFTLFSIKFPSNIYSILFGCKDINIYLLNKNCLNIEYLCQFLRYRKGIYIDHFMKSSSDAQPRFFTFFAMH